MGSAGFSGFVLYNASIKTKVYQNIQFWLYIPLDVIVKKTWENILVLDNKIVNIAVFLIDLNSVTAADFMTGNHILGNHFITELQLVLVDFLINPCLGETAVREPPSCEKSS